MQLSKSDIEIAIRYLEDAAKFYAAAPPNTRISNRIRLIKLHINKLKIKLNNDKTRHY